MPRTFFLSRTRLDLSIDIRHLGDYSVASLRAGIASCAVTSGIDFGVGEVIPDVLVEVSPLGFRQQQFLIGLCGNAAVALDRAAPEFQFQKGVLVLVGSGIQRGGPQVDSCHELS
jgi:hypothetical protein